MRCVAVIRLTLQFRQFATPPCRWDWPRRQPRLACCRCGIAIWRRSVVLRLEVGARRTRHEVRVTVGEHEHIAGLHLHRLPAHDPAVAAAAGQDVVADEVLGMRQDPREIAATFKFLVAGNSKPRLRTVNEASRRRFVLIPFTVKIPKEERDRELPAKLRESHIPDFQALSPQLTWQLRLGML